MADKLIAAATVQDVAVCLALDPPKAGVNVGGGIHVVIPEDWKERIAAGQDVPGCTYARLESDGSLYVSDVVQTKLSDPEATKDLPSKDISALKAELTAVAVGEVAAKEVKGPP